MSEILDNAFEEWTKGRDEIAARISIFENVRDIIYAIIPEMRNYEKGPEECLAGMRGSCTPKHFLLGRMFERMDLEVRYVTYPFKWGAQDIAYPDEIRRLGETIPTEYHLACKVLIDGRWVLVDATWDPALAEVGCPVNMSWDGVSDTKLALNALDEIEHEDAYAREEYVKDKKRSWTPEEHAQEAVLCAGINRWFEAVRTGGAY